MSDLQTSEPWPTLLKYAAPSIIPDVKETQESRNRKKVHVYIFYNCFSDKI